MFSPPESVSLVSLGLSVGFHALTRLDGGQTLDPPVIMHTERQGPFYCHPQDARNPVSAKHIIKAAQIYQLLESAALLSHFPDYRYPLFWQGLESLFTSDTKTWKVTERLCTRISYFLADNSQDQPKLFKMVDECYKTRSRIIHGRWDEGPEIVRRMADTEAIVRTVVRHILEKPGMLGAFVSLKRDDFLETWVQSKGFVPPPFPS